MIVDAHHHFWNPARIPQSWMTADHAVIDRAFEPADLEPLLAASGVERTVLVQSAASDADTDYMFEVAGSVDFVGAIVAWIRLDDAAAAHARLSQLAGQPKLRGIRHLIHQERDPHWVLRREAQDGIAAVAAAGLVLELPAEFPNHLGDVPALARRHPDLTIVIDHLAKPPLGTPALRRWRQQLFAAAQSPNVLAKVSGLNTVLPHGNWTPDDLRPAVATAVGAFGAERLMLGSDWPVALLKGGYADVLARTADAVRAAAGGAADEILGRTAWRVYRLH